MHADTKGGVEHVHIGVEHVHIGVEHVHTGAKHVVHTGVKHVHTGGARTVRVSTRGEEGSHKKDEEAQGEDAGRG